MTALQAKAEQAADLLIEIARDAPRRGVVAERVLASTVLAASPHLRDVLTAEVLEALAHRLAGQPGGADSPIAQTLKASYLADGLTGAPR